jgi:hypothetical protein
MGIFFKFSTAVVYPVITREITLFVPSRGDNDYVISRLQKKSLEFGSYSSKHGGFLWVICFVTIYYCRLQKMTRKYACTRE